MQPITTQIIGYIAGTCTTFSGIPQIVQMVKTKSTKDVSYASLSLMATGVVLWTVYGIAEHSGPVTVFNILSTFLYTTLIGYKAYNERRQQLAQNSDLEKQHIISTNQPMSN